MITQMTGSDILNELKNAVDRIDAGVFVGRDEMRALLGKCVLGYNFQENEDDEKLKCYNEVVEAVELNAPIPSVGHLTGNEQTSFLFLAAFSTAIYCSSNNCGVDVSVFVSLLKAALTDDERRRIVTLNLMPLLEQLPKKFRGKHQVDVLKLLVADLM